jgi:hypothetical protein
MMPQEIPLTTTLMRRTDTPTVTPSTAAPLEVTVGSAHVRLFHEDCIAGMARHLEPGAVDVIVTSPPYNLGVSYSQYDDSGSRAEYLGWLDRWAAEVKRVLHPQGSLFLNLGSKPTDPWVPYEVLMVMRRHFALQNQIHWIKSIALLDEPARGHVKPVNSDRFLNDAHEFIFHLTPHGRTPLDKLAIEVPFADKSNLGRGDAGRTGIGGTGATSGLSPIRPSSVGTRIVRTPPPSRPTYRRSVFGYTGWRERAWYATPSWGSGIPESRAYGWG